MNNAEIKNVSIISIDGKIVFEKSIQENDKYQVDVSGFANGIYLINVISSEGNIYSEKLIKN